MNLNDFDAGEGPTTTEERRTAQLCAYLFGELDAPEGAELETALAGDAELRAELESLRATIGLMRGEHAADAGSEPRLSASAMASLTAQAAGPKLSLVAPSLQKTTVIQGLFNHAGRYAAVCLLLMGSLLGFLQSGTLNHDAHVAQFGYDIGGENQRKPRTALAPVVEIPYTGALVVQERTSWTKRMEPSAVRDSLKLSRPGLSASVEAPSGGGGSSSGPSTPGPGGPATGGFPATLGVSLGATSSEQPRFRAFAVGGAQPNPTKASAQERKRSRGKEALAKAEQLWELAALGYGGGDREAKTGGDLFFLGRGEKDASAREVEISWTGRVTLPETQRWDELLETRGRSLEERARKLADQWIAHCQPGPSERPRDMYFRFWGDNPYVFSSQDKLATFAADVDTASYALARRYLVDGMLPTKAQIRTEEFVNAFKPDVPAPTEETFAVTTELAPSPFGGSDSRWMLRVTVRGREVSREQRQPLAITFVVDTSGSMKEGKRLELVKHALRLLVSQLDARDSIALVAFSNEARLILPMTSAAQRGVIEAAIFPLQPGGGTNAEAGLKLGYELAATGLASGVHNRVVFLSDGVANLGQTDQDQLSADVKHRRDQGIYLSTIGVGMGNHNDVFLERLADQGDGICDYVDDAAAVERAIVERFTGAFIPIASDVKIQVEFDPKRVLRWRQIGYENRAVADADFRNDAVDAGEIGAGHQVTALFEIERVGSGVAAESDALATVRLRWKEPKGVGKDPREARVTEIEHTLAAKQALGLFESASAGFQRAVLVAQFSEVLRRSNHAQGDSYQRLVTEVQRLRSLPTWANDADTKELLALVVRAGNLGAGSTSERDDLTQVIDEYRRHQYLRCQLDGLEQKVGGAELEELQKVNDRLKLRIRDLCLQRLR